MPKEILINSTGQTSLFIKMINNALESSYILNKIALMWKKQTYYSKCEHVGTIEVVCCGEISHTQTHIHTHKLHDSKRRIKHW